MKKLLLIALSFLPLLSMAQDDLYFTPKKKAAKDSTVKTAPAASVTDVKAPLTVSYNTKSRAEDEYNRRYTYKGQIAGVDDWQAGGSKEQADSLAASIDSVRSGYSRDMNDMEDDYYYSRRLLRFHSPRFVAYTRPYYWDLVYGYGCYDYLDFWYDDPFYWHYGWHYGWSWGPWSCWYGPLWGWHSPYAWDYWGWGGCWGYYSYGHGGYWGGGHYTNPRTQGVQRFDRLFTGRAGGSRTVRTSSLAGASRSSRTGVGLDRSSRTSSRGDFASRTSSRSGMGAMSRTSSIYDRATSSRTSSYGTRSNGMSRTSVGSSRGSAVSSSRTSAGTYSSRTSAGSYSSSRTSAGSYSPSRSSVGTYSSSNSSTSRSSSSSSSYTPSRSTSTYSGGSYSSGGGGGFSGGGGGGGSRGGGGGGGGRR